MFIGKKKVVCFFKCSSFPTEDILIKADWIHFKPFPYNAELKKTQMTSWLKVITTD